MTDNEVKEDIKEVVEDAEYPVIPSQPVIEENPKVQTKIGRSVYDNDDIQLPENKKFRDAWKINGDVVEIDMTKARKIYRDELRRDRVSLMERNDIEIAKLQRKKEFDPDNFSDDDFKEVKELLDDQQRLRDITKDSRITKCKTASELEKLEILK